MSEKRWNEHTEQNVDIHDQEKHTGWGDLSDERRKQIETGGGLAAGLGLLGAGYLAYHHHEKDEEEKKAQIWSLQNWVDNSKKRTANYRQGNVNEPATWIYGEGKSFPNNAIPGGEENGKTQHIIRAFYEGGIHVGKGGDFAKAASIAYGGEEISVDVYEVLVGDRNAVKWVNVQGRLSVGNLGAKPVEGGKEKNGTPEYIAKAPYKGGVHVGKVEEGFEGAHISWGGDEKTVEEYEVLCYA